MKNEICKGDSKVYKIVSLDDRLIKRYNVERMTFFSCTASNVPRIRIKCPICGRKVFSRIKVDHDGLEIYHFLPPHKVKKWWKKNKKLKKSKVKGRQV